MDLTIIHDEPSHRFVCVSEGYECVAEYEAKGTVVDVYRTFVHPALRGRGIAEKLMAATIDHARKNGRTIFPSCSYTLRFFQRHPEHQDVLDGSADLDTGGSCRIE
jgi:uncharacterized protein